MMAVNLTAKERPALAELAKPAGQRDYSAVHGRTIHALQRKRLFGSNGKPGGALTPAGRAELAVPNIFDDLFAQKETPRMKKTQSPDALTVVPGHQVTYHNAPHPDSPAGRYAANKAKRSRGVKAPAEFRAIEHVATDLHDPVRDCWEPSQSEGGVRLYCTSSSASWALQVRARVKTKRGGTGKHFAISTASMSREDLQWLRDLIDAELVRGTK